MFSLGKLQLALLLTGIFLASSGLTYLVKSSGSESSPPHLAQTPPPSPTPPTKKSKIDPSLPRTEKCPLNGEMFTKQEKDVWMTRRPLAVMVENSPDARPQSGLTQADIVYEAVAEGGITRFMAIYYCDAALAGNLQIAPVRSARIYFVNLLSEYDALYNHVGGAGHCDDPNVDPRAKALCLIKTAKIKSLDQMGYAGEFKICRRNANRLDRQVAYEHTMSCFLEELYRKADRLGWGYQDHKNIPWDKEFVPWKFQSPGEKTQGDPAVDINYHFWDQNKTTYAVNWKYDPQSNTYSRISAGEISIDLNNHEPLKFSTVIVQLTPETFTNDLEKHLLYDVIGSGKALIFADGVVVPAVWSKSSRTARTIYKSLHNKEVPLNPGKIWISIVPATNSVSYN